MCKRYTVWKHVKNTDLPRFLELRGCQSAFQSTPLHTRACFFFGHKKPAWDKKPLMNSTNIHQFFQVVQLGDWYFKTYYRPSLQALSPWHIGFRPPFPHQELSNATWTNLRSAMARTTRQSRTTMRLIPCFLYKVYLIRSHGSTEVDHPWHEPVDSKPSNQGW